MRRAIIEDAQNAGTDYNTIVNARKGGGWAPTPRSGLSLIAWDDLDAAAKTAKEKIAALDETIKSLDVPPKILQRAYDELSGLTWEGQRGKEFADADDATEALAPRGSEDGFGDRGLCLGSGHFTERTVSVLRRIFDKFAENNFNINDTDAATLTTMQTLQRSSSEYLNLAQFRAYLRATGQLEKVAECVHDVTTWEGSHLAWYSAEDAHLESDRPKAFLSCMSFPQFVAFHRAHVGVEYPPLSEQLRMLGIPFMTHEEERRARITYHFEAISTFMGEARSHRIAELKRSRVREEKKERRRRERLAAKEGRTLRPPLPRVDKPDEKDIPHDQIDPDSLQMLLWKVHGTDANMQLCHIIHEHLCAGTSSAAEDEILDRSVISTGPVQSPDGNLRPSKADVIQFLDTAAPPDLAPFRRELAAAQNDSRPSSSKSTSRNARPRSRKGNVKVFPPIRSMSPFFSRMRIRTKNFVAYARMLGRQISQRMDRAAALYGPFGGEEVARTFTTNVSFAVGDLKMPRLRVSPGNRIDSTLDLERLKPLDIAGMLDDMGAPESASSFISITFRLKAGLDTALLERDVENVAKVLVKRHLSSTLQELPMFSEYDAVVIEEEGGGMYFLSQLTLRETEKL